MRLQYLKLGNVAHSLSFDVFTAFRRTNFYILLVLPDVNTPSATLVLHAHLLFSLNVSMFYM